MSISLVEFDREAIGGLDFAADIPRVPAPGPRSKSWYYTYRFPEQVHHLDGTVIDPATQKRAGHIVLIDDDENTVVLRTSASPEDAARVTAIVPDRPVAANEQKRALLRVAEAYVAGTLAASHRVAADLLAANLPHLSDRPAGARIQPERVTPESVYAVATSLDRSYLVLQGPPGTGKTYTGARVVARLLLDGKRVGVMANSHKVDA